MPPTRSIALVVACAVAFALPIHAPAQQSDARALVQSVVANELEKDANDHSRWMYLDQKKEAGKDILKLVVQTKQGSLSKAIEIDGRPLTAEQEQEEQTKMHRFVTDAAVRQKQKKSDLEDAQKATSLTRMLPDAFLWTRTGEHGDEATLAFRPNPNFKPPTREARVFAAMQGTMVVDTKQKRIRSLQGTLISDVQFGWFGVLGNLKKGGTFHVERREVGPGLWQITATHVHIRGHALLFKSIGEDEDEETSHYQPVPASMTLEEAERMLNDGTIAKELGVVQPQ